MRRTIMRQTLCKCLLITQRDVVRVIRAGARTVDAVSEACQAGTGCGSCRGPIAVLLDEEAQRRSRRQAAAARMQLGLFRD